MSRFRNGGVSPTGIGSLLKEWTTSDIDNMRKIDQTTGDDYANTAYDWLGYEMYHKVWDKDCALCNFTYITCGTKSTDKYTAGGGTYWFYICCSLYQDFNDPGDGASVGGNLDFYRDDNHRLEALNTLDGDRWYRWQGVISVGSGNKIFPRFETRSRAENYITTATTSGPMPTPIITVSTITMPSFTHTANPAILSFNSEARNDDPWFPTMRHHK